MRTLFLTMIAMIASSASAYDSFSWGQPTTRAQQYAQKREEQRLIREQQRQAAEMVRAQRQAEATQQRALIAQQREAARQQMLQQREALRQQREQARQAKIAARNGGYNNGFAQSNYGDSYSGNTFGGFGGGSAHAGHRCSPSDNDESLCYQCAVYGEDRGSVDGMRNVVGTIKERIASGQYGSSACDVVWGRGQKCPRCQFVGAWGKVLKEDRPGQLNDIAAAQSAGRNGHMGFKTCGSRGARGVRHGGNCFSDATPHIELLPQTATAEQVEQQSFENYLNYLQFAEINGEDDAG